MLFAAAETCPQNAQRVGILHRGRRERLPLTRRSVARAEEILEDTIPGKSFATAGFEISEAITRAVKLKKLQKPYSLVAKAKYHTEKQNRQIQPEKTVRSMKTSVAGTPGCPENIRQALS